MNILILKQDKESRDLIGFTFESKLRAHVALAVDVQTAVDKLLEETIFDLLICEVSPDLTKLFKFLMSTNSKVPIILVSDSADDAQRTSFPEINIVGHVASTNTLPSLLHLIGELIKSKSISLTPAPPIDYCRIKIELLLKVAPLKGDIFIRLSDTKFVKFYKKGAVFNLYDFDRILMEKKLEYLYIHKSDANEFITKLHRDLAATANDVRPDDGNPSSFAVGLHETVHELVQHLGFTEEIQKVAKENVDLTVKALGESPNLSKILNLLNVEKDKYISSHSVLLANIACCLAKMMNWPSNTTFQKLTLAAFCHDLSLANHSLAQINTIEELEKSGFSAEEKKDYLLHPTKGADWIKKFQEIPSDVDLIVAQHHERSDGKGFPRGLSAQQIAPLASIFIVAHDVVNEIFTQGKSINVEEFIRNNQDKYSMGNFKKIVATIVSQSKASA